jgi:hypothetical protein
MLHLPQNIKLVRLTADLNQEDFAKIFTGVTTAMIKSYEKSTNPSALFMQELSELSAVSEKDLREKALKKGDITINEEIVDKVKKVEYNTDVPPGSKTIKTTPIDYKDKYIQQLEDNNKFLKSQGEGSQAIIDDKEQRIKSLESVVNSLTQQLAEKNDIIGRLQRMELSLNVLVKTLSAELTKARASQE